MFACAFVGRVLTHPGTVIRVGSECTRFVFLMSAALLAWVTAASAETVGFSPGRRRKRLAHHVHCRHAGGGQNPRITLHFDDAQGNVERQFAAVRRFIAERVDAIIIAPVVVTGWTPVLKEARAANIPVFIADRSVDAETSLFVARIGNDTNLEGRLRIVVGSGKSRTLFIVELSGVHRRCSDDRAQGGFRSGHRAISRHADHPLGERRFHRGRRPAGHGGTSSNSTDGLKDICAVWAHNDDMMLGAIDVMKSAGLHPGKDVLTIRPMACQVSIAPC